MKTFTLIFSYRKRDSEDLIRFNESLISLQNQSCPAFEVICVDYGNAKNDSLELEKVLVKYSFARIVKTETQGFLWNRAHALNTALREVKTDYVATTDIDAIFHEKFIEVLTPLFNEKSYFVCGAHDLDFGFRAVDFSSLDFDSFEEPKKNCGIFQAMQTDVIKEINGFDEYYRYWGKEDKDLERRLLLKGLQKINLWGKTYLGHQTHFKDTQVEATFSSAEFSGRRMSSFLWGNICGHYLQQSMKIVRNDFGWGKCFKQNNRPILSFVSETGEVLKNDGFVEFKLWRDDLKNVHRFVYDFIEQPSGQCVVILYRKENVDFEAFLYQWIPDSNDVVEDYYFNFNPEERFALLMRK